MSSFEQRWPVARARATVDKWDWRLRVHHDIKRTADYVDESGIRCAGLISQPGYPTKLICGFLTARTTRYAAMNEAIVFFRDARPARTTVQSGFALPGMKVESIAPHT
jgi:hypothetical protein